MEDLAQLVIKTYGIAGLIMISPFIAVVFLWRHCVSQAKEQAAEISRINEQRVAELKATTEKLVALISEQSALNKETNMALERVGDVLLHLPSINQKR
jgi:single-stranded DNA-specific DHH superfamily exonuclease